ncbi:MAG: DUF3830 family protein [Chloroflexi bacterium]|nr:DUF3830 family protein [Chloroflexota bacterium]
MTTLQITIGPLHFAARLELERAPRTSAALLALLPFRNQLLQARWSGEAAWVPLGDLVVPVGVENATSYPAPGDILFYPGGYSETELLVPYGPTRFASKLGQLAGNHVLTITEGREQLTEIGRLVLHEGAQSIAIEAIQ